VERIRHRQMEGVDVYSTAKSEYTEQFCLFLVPALQSYFLGLIDDAKEREKDQRKILWMFQNLLKDIPDWNQDKVLRETEKIVQTSRCDYLEELLTAVFIAHTKVLSAIRLTNREKKKIQITVPKLEHFLHRSLSESARILWSNAYLFSEQGTSIERQKNLRQVESLLHQAVLQSIRGMLPVKNILREYLNNDGEEEGEEAESSGKKNEEEEEEEKEPEKEVEKEVETDVKKEEKEEEVGISIDLSGSFSEIATTEETKEVPEAPPNTPANVSPDSEAGTESIPIPSIAEIPPPPPQPQQVLVFETEPSVKFAEHDTVFDTENQMAHRIRSKSADLDNDEEEDDEQIAILDEAPQAMDGFEDLESTKETGVDDFETLE
jgi:SHS2 domain-containing protein